MIIGQPIASLEVERRCSGSLVSLCGRPYALIYDGDDRPSVLTTFAKAWFAGSIWQLCRSLFLARHGQYLGGLSGFHGTAKSSARAAHDLSVIERFGATMAVGFLHGWVKFASFRNSARLDLQFLARHQGIDWAGMADLWGCFLGYLTFIALLVGIRFLA